jgi:RHS repeat-associated protein
MKMVSTYILLINIFLIYAQSNISSVGNKSYEITNHLGNVLAVTTDRKIQKNTESEIVTFNDYYPYGMLMEGRHGQKDTSNYRYAFQGQEKDDEIKDTGNSYTTEYRQYDYRLARWTSLDPVSHYQYSPYSAYDNNPTYFIDPNGAESENPAPKKHTVKEGETIWSIAKDRLGTNATNAEIATLKNDIKKWNNLTSETAKEITAGQELIVSAPSLDVNSKEININENKIVISETPYPKVNVKFPLLDFKDLKERKLKEEYNSSYRGMYMIYDSEGNYIRTQKAMSFEEYKVWKKNNDEMNIRMQRLQNWQMLYGNSSAGSGDGFWLVLFSIFTGPSSAGTMTLGTVTSTAVEGAFYDVLINEAEPDFDLPPIITSKEDVIIEGGKAIINELNNEDK